MPMAKFGGKSCCMCGSEFIPGETEIEVHPTQVGPRGGKVWVCAVHLDEKSNPVQVRKGRGKYAQTAKSMRDTDRHERNMYDASLEPSYFDDVFSGSYRTPPAPVKEYKKQSNPRGRKSRY